MLIVKIQKLQNLRLLSILNMKQRDLRRRSNPIEEEIRELEDEWASYYNIV